MRGFEPHSSHFFLFLEERRRGGRWWGQKQKRDGTGTGRTTRFLPRLIHIHCPFPIPLSITTPLPFPFKITDNNLLLPRRPTLLPQSRVIRLRQLFPLEPLTIGVPHLGESEVARVKGVVEDVEMEAFGLGGAGEPNGAVGGFPGFDLGGVDVEVDEEGEVVRCRHCGG